MYCLQRFLFPQYSQLSFFSLVKSTICKLQYCILYHFSTHKKRKKNRRQLDGGRCHFFSWYGTVATTTVDVGGHVAPGNSIGTLTVSGSMAISGTLDVEYDDSLTQPIDLLNVSGTLDITAATVDFADISSGVLGLSEPAYVFATYGTLTGSQFASVVDLPTGYSINYAYAGNNIALVPEPTAALLAGLGVLALLRRRRA